MQGSLITYAMGLSPGAGARRGPGEDRAEILHTASGKTSGGHRGAGDAAAPRRCDEELCSDVRGDFYPWKSSDHGQRHGHRRVDVCARGRAEHVDRRRDHEREREGDDPEPGVADLASPVASAATTAPAPNTTSNAVPTASASRR